MKVRVTEQIRDDFKVASFHKLDSLKLQIKNLNKEIEILEEEFSVWKEMYLSDKTKTSQVLVTSNDSEMHILIDKLSEIKLRISELHEKVEESEVKTGKVDPAIKKEYDLLLPVLREDLEIIQEKINKADKDNELFLENFNELEAEYKKCRQELKNKNKELLKLTNLYKKILKNVKNVDELCEKNKKIPQRKLELIKF